jgi:AcrR family transcriptional regulator
VSRDTEAEGQVTRRERRKLEVRNRILAAATALFDREGFGATTVAAICERADVAHKTFFNHFPAKRDLLREIASIYLDTLLRDIEETRKQPGPTRERIDFFFARVADSLLSAGPMRRELVTEVIHVAHEARTEAEQARKLHAAFGSLILDGIANGDVTQRYDADTLIDMLKGAFYALMFNWSNLEDYSLREHALSSARFLGDAISAEGRPESA